MNEIAFSPLEHGMPTLDANVSERGVRSVMSTTIERSERLRQACSVLAETFDRDQILTRLVEAIDDQMELERIFVVLTDAEGSRIWADLRRESGHEVVIGRGELHPNLLVGTFEDESRVCSGTMAVGLVVNGRDLGFVGVMPTPDRSLDIDDRHALSVLARQAAVSLLNASMFEHASALGALKERHRIASELRDGLISDLREAEGLATCISQAFERAAPNKKQLALLEAITGRALREASSWIDELLKSAPAVAGSTPEDDSEGAVAEDANDARSEILVDLTTREHEVVELVAMGLSNADIAQRLALSINTVKNHVSRSMAKYGARSRTELAALLFGERES